MGRYLIIKIMSSLAHVRFKLVPEKLEIDTLYGFLFEDPWGWGGRIVRKHPNIKPVLKLTQESVRIQYLRKYVRDFRRSRAVEMQRQLEKLPRAWGRVEQPAFIALQQLIETNWPKQRPIHALMSINPICPRFLREWTFFWYWRYKQKDIFEIILHECSHFLYFQKWQEVFPQDRPRSFDSPHLIWHLSEILTPILLMQPELQKYLRQKPTFYREHQRLRIKGKTAPAYFRDLYHRSRNRHESFACFLIKARKAIEQQKRKFANVYS